MTAVLLVADLCGAIGVNSFAALTCDAIANASAWTLPHHQRRWPRPLAGLGVNGCMLLAATLPTMSVLGGVAVLTVGRSDLGRSPPALGSRGAVSYPRDRDEVGEQPHPQPLGLTHITRPRAMAKRAGDLLLPDAPFRDLHEASRPPAA